MRPNWFVAIPVAGAEIAGRMPPPPPGVRTFHRDDLHLTIAFLGPVDEARAHEAFGALDWSLGELEVTFGEVVPMGNPRRFSALSALLVHGRAEVEAAMGASRDAVCAAAGVEVDPRPPKAHVTVARPSRRATDSDRKAALRWARFVDLSGITVRLDTVALYTWSEDRADRLFRTVAHRGS